MYIGGNIVRDGLVLHLDAGSERSYPKSGTVWRDLSGGGNNGTLTNGPTFDSNNNGGIVFDGVDDRIQTPTNTILGTFNDWSVDAWVRWRNVGYVSWMIVVDQATYSKYYKNIMVWLDSNSSLKKIAMYDGSWQYSNNTIPPNQWTHIAATTNGTTAKMYINGNLDATRTFTWNLTTDVTNYLGVGSHGSNSSYKFNGNINLVKIYNRTLSDDEVLQNYNATKKRFGL